jgi:hypothetical protein
MSMPVVQAPEKELRFTRSGQAAVFWVLAAVLAMAGVTLFAISFHRGDNPALPHGAWSLPPLMAAAALARLAVHLTRHAYVILTPLGIEVFPFFRPATGMQMILWHEIDSAEVDATAAVLTLHYNAEKSAGLHLTLRPVSAARRALLVRAVTGRLAERGGAP